MTHEQFLTKVAELLPDLDKWILEKAESITKSGAIEFSDFEDNYALPKAFLSAMGKEIEFQYRPLDAQGKKVAKNIQHFI